MLDKDKFVAPGPGAWELEQTHLQRPIARWMHEIFPQNMMRGFKETTKKYGLLLDYLEVAVVNNFGYACPRPVGAPKGAKGPPPKLVFKILTKLHPEIRRRVKRSAEVWERKAWRDDVKMWHEQWLPQVNAANRALLDVDPRALDDAKLLEHIDAVRARCEDGIYRHHALNGCAMVAVGDFLVHAMEWTGKGVSELIALLRSPVSSGAKPQLDKLAAAIRADKAAGDKLASSAPAGEIVEALRTASGEVGPAARAYLDEAGLRLVGGYDVAEQCGLEVPEVLVGAMRVAVADAKPARPEDDKRALDEATAKIRALVPEAHRAEFDDKLAEARLVYPIRDERTYMNDLPALGLARRALMAAGERLAAKGKLAAADHVVELSHEQLHALFAGKSGPSKDEVAERVKFRTTYTIADAPTHIGLPPSKPPPADWLPPPAARMARALGVILQQMFDVSEARGEAKIVRGLPASPGTYEGRARVVLGPEQFSKIEKGDILVTRMTSPAYNVLLPLLGGVVTDRGGLLSHAAIVAREYGVPAVVGTTEGTRVIPDAARVRIDGTTGEVRVL